MTFTKFDRVVCVNLPQRTDRWDEFMAAVPKDWNFGEIERYAAVVGKRCPRPDWWRAGGGAWGCYRSHVRILEECLNNEVNSCLFLEDDARFCEGFTQKAHEFIDSLPDDWGFIYLGGQHFHARRHPPTKIGDNCYVPYNVNRTHAFAIRGRTAMSRVYKHLNDTKSWRGTHHIDHHLGRLHQRRDMPIYCPAEWLVAQGAGYSNISGRTNPERVWNHAANIITLPHPLTLVLGPHRCGSSCVAMMMHKLGAHLGNKFVGAEDKRGGSGEAHELMQCMEAALPLPALEPVLDEVRVRNRLQKLILRMTREAEGKGTVAALKYPQLAMFAHVIEHLCDEQIRVVDVRRPIEESVLSLQRRQPGMNTEEVTDHQHLLYDLRNQYVEEFNGPKIRIEYDDVLSDPQRVVDSLIEFLGITPTPEQVAAAVAHPKKQHRHITGETLNGVDAG